MPPLEKMYYCLFNAITDALRALEAQDHTGAAKILINAQKEGETMYVEASDEAQPPERS